MAWYGMAWLEMRIAGTAERHGALDGRTQRLALVISPLILERAGQGLENGACEREPALSLDRRSSVENDLRDRAGHGDK